MSHHATWVFIGDEQRGTDEALKDMVAAVLRGEEETHGRYCPWDSWAIVGEPVRPLSLSADDIAGRAYAICSDNAGYHERKLWTGLSWIENPDWDELIEHQRQEYAHGYLVLVDMHT